MQKKLILPSLLLIMAMFSVAEYSGQQEIIFPEIAALALGAWIMKKTPWRCTPLDLWLSPTLAALTGILMVRYVSYSPFLMITGAFCLVVLQLKLMRSGVLPSISAAILAIISRTDSWYYPLSVCILTGTIALGHAALNRSELRKAPSAGLDKYRDVQKESEDQGVMSGLLHWSKLLAGVMAVAAVAASTGRLFMIAPPLIVAFVELSKPGGSLWNKSGKVLGLLFFAAVSGVLWCVLFTSVLGWPLWICAGAATVTVFLAYHVLHLPFPPAVAIALLPTILTRESLWSYPWQVLFGSAAFLLASKACTARLGQMASLEGSSTE